MAARLHGLIAATFTPFAEDGELALEGVEAIAERLITEGVKGLFVAGTTGEGESLSAAERRAVAQAHVEAAAGRVPVIVQVGHNSLREAQALAADAREAGAQAIALTAPCYFKPRTSELLAAWIAEVGAAAHGLPVYFYHIPSLTGVELPLPDLLRAAARALPSFAGVKLSKPDILELQACVALDGGRFDVLFGCDELLLAGLASGARGAVGSTYNFAAPLYGGLLEAFERGDLAEACRRQALAVSMIETILRHGGPPALKAVMGLAGLDCGPVRLPQERLRPEQVEALRRDLGAIGFFDWARPAGSGGAPR
jgi:N-acetylneuraminate lyase